MRNFTAVGMFVILASLALLPWVSASSLPYPCLGFVERELLTTATDEFGGNAQLFANAVKWNQDRLRATHSSISTKSQAIRAPHFACGEYDRGRDIFSRLEGLLSSGAVRAVSHSSEHGVCFLVTASHAQVGQILADDDQFGLTSLAPFPSAMKLAPGLLEHRNDSRTGRLSASHGTSLRLGNVEGLSVELSPGTLPAQSPKADSFIENMLEDLMSESLDLIGINFWSDESMFEDENLDGPGVAARRRDWGMVATLVHELARSGSTSPGDICSWGSVFVDHPADDILLVQGLNHLLYLGRGASGDEEEATELHVACFMALVSFLASRHEILRVAPTRSARTLDATVRAVIQSATPTQTPLTDAGLDGTGEVIQIVDSGLDETSCFFVDGDGQEVTHGYYFDEMSESYSSVSVPAFTKFQGGDFSFEPSRRKIIQYIDMIKPDAATSASYFTTSGFSIPWIPADGFGDDEKAGHGTHTAGTAAGATLNNPAETTECDTGKTLSCAGACIDATGSDDDLVSSYYQADDIDRQCPFFGCDDDSDLCLGDDVGVTLAENGGMAQGAKLAIFDVFAGETSLAYYAGNGLWEPCLEAGCKIHSNSWGGDGVCTLSALDILYDEFMYKNPENLLVFAAGNDGENQFEAACTIGSPAIAKNVLAVGATSAGETRLNSDGIYDIDHVASLSSWGFTTDGRIKPEVVAPGDTIYSAAGDGTDLHTCRLWAYQGTSMSTPVVAGASAMVRQYFVDTSFYAADVASRGFCREGFLCEGFSPSSATVKALLINSANLMGGVPEPDGYRGFGRIHLESGLPLNGEGSLALFVADAGDTFIPDSSETEYHFDVDADAGLEFRATLSWIDPPATTFSGFQLVHDLDLTVVSPSGTTHTMWSSGEKDAVNVNERVAVGAADVESGTWKVFVSSNSFSAAEEQSYSLVVNGAISPPPGGVVNDTFSSASNPTVPSTWLSVALGAWMSFSAAIWMA